MKNKFREFICAEGMSKNVKNKRVFKRICFVILTAVFAVAIYAPVYGAYSHTVRVGLMRSFTNQNSINVQNTSIWVGYLVPEGFMPVRELNSVGGFTARSVGGRAELLSGGQVVHTFTGNVGWIMANDGDFVQLGSYRYRGIIEFIPTGGQISAVNILSIEEYLFGVLPSEMAPHFHPEALKAQAVAARTYTFNQIRQGAHTGFDICDRTCCQVYRGAASEDERTNAATLGTYGLMLFYDGQTILATYFSSSGGATENSEDVWWEARPYLRSVNEIVEHNPMVWERSFTWAQLTSAASAAGANIGTVNGVSVSRLGASGRALELTLHGANGTWVVPRSVGVRGFFSSIGGTLPSRNFTIQGATPSTPAINVSNGWQNFNAPLNTFQALDANGAISTVQMGYIFDGHTTRRINSTPSIASGGTGITLHGRGWGHGVGMSQMGAEGMAREGFLFREILLHYYTGVEIRWYDGF
ncbi:MAG: SpoIID/LytB domain-containing protein [Defluviitaleaceae bacterium]|nr:SpoIID/LytB domain-containing protein [Defluviitaleaceae bacterium]